MNSLLQLLMDYLYIDIFYITITIIIYMFHFIVGPAVSPANLVLKPGETTLASLEFYLTVPDGDLEFEIFESSGNVVSCFSKFCSLKINF